MAIHMTLGKIYGLLKLIELDIYSLSKQENLNKKIHKLRFTIKWQLEEQNLEKGNLGRWGQL